MEDISYIVRQGDISYIGRQGDISYKGKQGGYLDISGRLYHKWIWVDKRDISYIDGHEGYVIYR